MFREERVPVKFLERERQSSLSIRCKSIIKLKMEQEKLADVDKAVSPNAHRNHLPKGSNPAFIP